MLNRKIFALAAGLLTAITVTGTGFSAWYFDNVQARANATGRIDVTEIQTLNASVKLIDPAFASTNEFKLELDQVGDTGNGIRFLSTDGTTMIEDLGATVTINTENVSASFTFGSYFYIPRTLLIYLSVNPGVLGAPTDGWAESITAAADSLGVGVNSTKYEVFYIEEAITSTKSRNIDVETNSSDVNVFFTYKDSMVDSADKVKAMERAVESLKLHVVHRIF